MIKQSCAFVLLPCHCQPIKIKPSSDSQGPERPSELLSAGLLSQADRSRVSSWLSGFPAIPVSFLDFYGHIFFFYRHALGEQRSNSDGASCWWR